ncbi:hypothetical protein NQ314_004536 [Rhamnusium bicolor]|uniref:Ras-associating domain-containing protein n=1 Tax=Rhamnusium bicolor TaxID=1586634 RepID=A0AAV8ZMD4_9CUCU|nr:hypothetical protein NQ314_004536 [Rhamnusium bicolor]
MDPKWAIVEHLPDLYMERFYEDHELLVDNLLLWTRDSKNKIYFVEREDKIKLFLQPEKFLLSVTDKKENNDFDEHSRNMLASGLYYFPKDKVKSAKDLVCLATFDNNQIYYGLGWKKKYKAPTDFCFAIKHPRLQEPKSTKYIKYLCAEDHSALERWMIGMRIAKFGKQLMDNYRSLMDELAQEDLDILAHARSCSVSSIAVQSLQSLPSNVTTPTQGYPGSEAGYGTQSETYSAPSDLSSGRHSRASSSSSSGCMSDGAPSSCENAFDSEFPMGTIKRKPSMKPSLPLTNITRQLKEVGETRDDTDGTALPSSPVSYTNTGTLTRRHSRRKTSNSTDDSSSTGTLKRQHSYKTRGSLESMGGRSGTSTPLCGTPVRERTSPFGERNSPFSERPPSAGSVRTPVSPPSNMDMPSCMTDSITSLPPPPESNGDVIVNDSPSYQLPPPPPELYNSNLSLDSLPPPPNPSELPPMTGAELTGSQLSLMSLPPPPGENDTGTIRRKKGSVTPTNLLSPEQTPTLGMSPDQTPTHSRLNTPVCSPPLSNVGSNCSTPTQNNPPVSFSPTHRISYAQNSQIYGSAAQNHDRNTAEPVCGTNGYPNTLPSYVNPPQYRQASTLPSSVAFNNNTGLRSSLRQTSLPRQISSNSIASTNSSGSSGNSSVYGNVPYISELQAKNLQNSPSLQRKEVPPLPKKPLPPKRSESTKLSSPKKLVEPPVDFLKDLQRVMRKKWQVAQKCKLEPETTPHEVLGFRDPLFSYQIIRSITSQTGDNPDAVVEYATSPVHTRGEVRSGEFKTKRPPPPPPKRSETTHLSTPKTH